jgi:hypothetical protein
MHRFATILVATTTVFSLLACSGIGPSVRPQTASLCAHLSETNEAPCTAVPVGTPAAFSSFEVTVRSVHGLDGLDVTPANYEDRQEWNRAGEDGLYVVLDITNTAPVRAEIDFGVSLYPPDGEWRGKHFGITQAAAKALGASDSTSETAIGPGRTKTYVWGFAVPKGEQSEGMLSFQKTEYKPDPRDPRGRRRTFVVDQLIVELDAPVPSS